MRMNKDGLFKIMQITDMQEIPKVSPDTMALLDAAIEDEKPDLVVYTGDQIKGYGVSYKGKGKELENAVAKTINTLLEPVTKRNIPFAVTFGNHDRQVGISNKDQFNDIYKALPNCIGTQAEGIDGGGTYNIPIKASDGSDRDAFNLYLFDSGTDASSGSKVDDGTMLTRCFVGQSCKLGHNYSASDSLFFSNCQGENGEACAIFAGPFTVTHHKSTLLIAGMFSFMNAGSGSNQSNHMYKLGPIHQGTMERGAKTTSDSYILWPARVGAFSLVMGRHVNHADTSNLPFSYLIEQRNTTYLVPGVNLRSVGTIRDAQKWPKRDKRKDPNRLDYINYNLLSPYTIQKMFKGRSILKELKRVSGETSEIYSYQSAKIKNSSLNNGIRFYEIAIHKFLGNSIIKRLEGINFQTNEEIRQRLKPDTEIGLGEWVDVSGLIAPKSEIDRLLDGIENGTVNRLKSINASFAEMHENYYTYEWTWAYHKIQEFYGLNPETITAQDIIGIVKAWQQAVVGLDKMVYEDAKKEFSLSSMTGFGADGSHDEMKLDFEQVRGDFESNTFVTAVLKHIEDKTALGNELIKRIEAIEL